MSSCTGTCHLLVCRSVSISLPHISFRYFLQNSIVSFSSKINAVPLSAYQLLLIIHFSFSLNRHFKCFSLNMSDERKDKKTEKIFLLCFSESNNIIAFQKILLHMYIYIHDHLIFLQVQQYYD